MVKRILIAFLLFFVLVPQLKAQQPIRVKSTTESSNGKHRPVFYIVWPNDFSGNKYDVRVHISYDVKTSDGSWHNYNDATIYGVSGKYSLEWVYAYTKPIVDMKIRIKSIDGYNQPSNSSTMDNKSNNSGGYITPPNFGGGDGGGMSGMNLVLSTGYLVSRICYGPFAEAALCFGSDRGALLSFGYGGRGHESIWRFGTGLYTISDNEKNEFRLSIDFIYESTKLEYEKNDMLVLAKLGYTHYILKKNWLGLFVEGGIGMGGMNILSDGTAEEDIFGAGLLFGLRFNLANLINN